MNSGNNFWDSDYEPQPDMGRAMGPPPNGERIMSVYSWVVKTYASMVPELSSASTYRVTFAPEMLIPLIPEGRLAKLVRGGNPPLVNSAPSSFLILEASRDVWDRPETRSTVRKNFAKLLDCGTAALGWEMYASDNEEKRL